MVIDFRVLIRHQDALLEGLQWTLIMFGAGFAIGAGLGLAACVGKLIRRGLFSWISIAYIEVFRTLPEMVTLFWIYYCAPLIFDVRLSTNMSGLVAISLFAGAFLAEIFRGGVLAVPKGQIEAGRSLGVSELWIWCHVIAPQALRIMAPPMVIFLTDLVKATGLLAAIGVTEVVFQAMVISGKTFR